MVRRISSNGIPGFDAEQHAAALLMLGDLQCPVGVDGTRMAFIGPLETMVPILIYHCVRAGWRIDMTKRRIKKRKIYGAGMIEGAIDWVPISAPDDPLAGLEHMTIAQIDALEPADVRAEARRRLGLPVDPPAPVEGWHTTTAITITDEPEVRTDD